MFRFSRPINLLLLLLLSAPFYAGAQGISTKDSLMLNAWFKKSADNLGSVDSVNLYMGKVLAFAKKNNRNGALILAYDHLGTSHGSAGYISKSIFYYKKRYELTKPPYDVIRGDAAFSLGRAYVQLGNHELAFKYTVEALDFYKNEKNEIGMARCYALLGSIYYYKLDSKKGVEYINRAIALFRKLNNMEGFLETVLTGSEIYMEAGLQTEALSLLYEAEANAERLNHWTLGAIIQQIGVNAFNANKMDVAEKYYLKSLKEAMILQKDIQTFDITINLGELYTKTGRYELAEKYLLSALEMAKKSDGNLWYRFVYEKLTQLYAAKKDYAKAFENQKLFIIHADSLMNEEKMKAIEEMSVKFETKEIADKNELLQKENALQKLKVEQQHMRRNNILYVSISIVVLLLTGISFLYYYFRQKNKSNISRNNDLKQKLLLTQMNPHFIFNSVDNIQSLIHNKQDKEAINYLTKFSKLTRQILENSRENYILLSEEIAMLENYLTIQKLLYNNNFTYEINMDEGIDPESMLVPPMLTQPFIENAIKHGLKNKQAGGLIRIYYRLRDGQLHFEVTDNGTGLVYENKTQKSLSTEITRERLESIAGKESSTIYTSDIIGMNNDVQGVKTYFNIPYVYNN